MSTLYSTGLSGADLRAVLSFAYPDIRAKAEKSELMEAPERSAAELEAEQRQIEARIAQARAEAAAETARRLEQEHDFQLKQTREQVQQTIAAFRQERKDYFERVETEVVRLALAIAGKILHREAQVDSMMLAALVRVSVEKMDAGTRVTARVPSSEADKWKAYFSEAGGEVSIAVVEDAALSAGDCVLETELGASDFSIDAQLKEVESGFFDLLAHRPGAE
jgi:flagellar assembly protein FliH